MCKISLDYGYLISYLLGRSLVCAAGLAQKWDLFLFEAAEENVVSTALARVVRMCLWPPP